MKQETELQSGVVERVFDFRNDRGEELRGILSEPAGECRGEAVVLSHGWSGYRSGPAGILTALARAYAAHGCRVLRFDYAGRGESDGEGLKTTLGTMGDDLVCAAKALDKAFSPTGIIYAGLCSGGNVVVGALPRLPKPSRLLLLSVYPFSDGDTFSRDVHRTWHYLGIYFRKVFRPDTWRRFFSGEVSLRNVGKVLFGHFTKKGKAATDAAGMKQAGDASAALPKGVKASAVEGRKDAENAPRRFLANFRKELPVQMIYGGADPDAVPAMKYYGDYAREHAIPIEIQTIPGAGHNFASAAHRHQLLDMIEW